MEKRVQLMTVIFVCVFIAVGGCIVGTGIYASHERQTLLVYSGAGLKSVMDGLGEAFEIETGVDVAIIYGGSGHIFGQFSTSKRGDIFIPGAEYYTRRGHFRKLKPNSDRACSFQRRCKYHSFMYSY